MKIASLADIEEIEQTPLAARAWARDTFTLISHAAETYGDAPALTWIPDATAFDETQSWSFSELRTEITRAANLFHELGCGPRDVVAYILPNLPQAHFVLWGAEASGVAFAINPALAPEMMLSLIASMKVKVLVIDTEVLAPETRMAFAASSLGDLETIVLIGDGEIASNYETISYSAAAARQPGDRLLSGRVFSPDDVSSGFCTGGTTGAPKVAMRTHGAEAINAHMTAAVLGGTIKRGDSLLCGLPLFHVNAILITGTMPWLLGAHVVLGPPAGYRDPALLKNFWRIVERYRLTLFSGVPTLYSALLNTPMDDADVSSLKLGVCGAAPMPVELFKRFEKATGIRILEGYGLTESACAAALNPPDGERRIGSVGLRLPYESIRVAIVEDGKAREAENGEVGTLAISGPNVFAGYADPAHNASAWIEFGDGERWLDTGDLGRVDEEGYFWLTGRKKELIIRGGHNIDPKMIEEALHRHADVALAAAIGRPDAYSGEVPVAYVELRNGSTATAGALLDFAAREVSERAAVPKDIIIVERLPMTAIGKLFKPTLVLREVEAVVREVASETGAVLQSVDVAQDPRRGVLVTAVVAEGAENLKEALGRYAFALDISAA